MNYHSDEWVMNQINRHYLFANELYDSNQIVGVFCQGSTNYGLDCENSDIDTKQQQYRPIVPANLDYAVQSCTNQDLDAELTEQQQKLPPSTASVKAYIEETLLGGAW